MTATTAPKAQIKHFQLTWDDGHDGPWSTNKPFTRQLDLWLPMQSVPMTTDVVSSNLDQGEVYNIMW